MKKIVIAFDVDGTLIKTGINKVNEITSITKYSNKNIIDLLKILSSFKNIKIIVWSGRGKQWAEQVIDFLNMKEYVDGYASKNHKGKDKNGKHIFEPNIKPDICIDDIMNCELGLLNLIVYEKGEWHGKNKK